MLESAFNRDPSRANAAIVLPAIREIADHDARGAGVLARVLAVIDPTAAEGQIRAFIDAAVARGDYVTASASAGTLIYQCIDSGRLAEALALAEKKADYTRQAGLGPWTQLLDKVRRLQVLNTMGQGESVLAEVQRLREHMETLPALRHPNDTISPWDVRETLFDTGRDAARQLSRWEDALDLNAAQVGSMHDRGALAAEIARARFNDYGPLLRLGRTDQALALLLECRQVFQDARDIEMLGKTFSALADIEDGRGHYDAAIRLERDALRYEYLAGDVIAIAVSYHNLGNYLRRLTRQPAPALACHLAAAVVYALIGATGTGVSAGNAVADLHEFGADATMPADVAGLCRQVGDIPGADLDRLLVTLAPDPDALEQLFQELISAVRKAASREQE